MKFLKPWVIGFVAALATICGLNAFATNTSNYFGYNPSTGLEAFHGNLISAGNSPVITGSGGCGTLVNATVGGASAGTVTIGTFSVSCTLTITFPSASPTGWNCTFGDLTTPADAVPQASTTSTTCVTTAATMVTGDTIKWVAVGY